MVDLLGSDIPDDSNNNDNNNDNINESNIHRFRW
jgi:hypothetical protein